MMKISAEKHSDVPVTTMALEGELDASNYTHVITRANELYREGTRNLLLDLSGLNFMASSGLVALHSIALIMRGETPLDPESGWDVMHTIANDLDAQPGPEKHVKLLNPQARVEKALQVSGFVKLFSIFDNRETALVSFAGD